MLGLRASFEIFGHNSNNLPTSLRAKLVDIWSSNFTSNSLIGDINGKIITINNKDFTTDYIPATSEATFSMPNEQAIIDADTDFIWFNSDTSIREVIVSELNGYDFTRSFIGYDTIAPYHIRRFALAKADAVFTESEIKLLHDYFDLSFIHNAETIFEGDIKSNRDFAQKLYTPYDSASLALFTRIEAAGDTLTSSLKNNIDTTIKALKTANLFDSRFDALHLPRCIGIGASKLNWIQDAFNLTFVGTPNFVTKLGINSNGDSYLKTGFKPYTHGVKFKQNDASFGYKISGTISGNRLMGASNSDYSRNVIIGSYGGANSALNDDLGGGFGTSDEIGYNALVRNSSTKYVQLKNLTSIDGVRTSNTPVDEEILLLAANYPAPNAGFIYPDTTYLDFSFIGAYISPTEFITMQNIINNFIANL